MGLGEEIVLQRKGESGERAQDQRIRMEPQDLGKITESRGFFKEGLRGVREVYRVQRRDGGPRESLGSWGRLQSLGEEHMR